MIFLQTGSTLAISLAVLMYQLDLSLQEIRRRGLKVAVIGIPKTIDNDIPVLF